MIELDHLQVELFGMNLIEASAGTGKTYAISCLYLRLIIEKGLTPEQILVVTYTEAATKELRGRIRGRIREALAVLEGEKSDDAFLSALAQQVAVEATAADQARRRLDLALKAFDTAAIFTIHGFCLRALQDNAFESGSLYDTELVTDQAPLLQEVVDDFWRRRFFAPTAPLLACALNRKLSPESLATFVAGLVTSPHLEVIPAYDAAAIAALEDACRYGFQALQELWARSQAEIRQIIREDKGLSRAAKNYHQDLLPGLLESLEIFLCGENPYDLFDGFEKFCAGFIEKQRLKRHSPPEHAFFTAAEGLRQGVEQRLLALRWELVLFCREELPRRKREGNLRCFDDLLNDLYAALTGENGPALASSLRERYRAALIDEFQDTDPVQYAIFRAIYAASAAPLFLIGDPKQAIYSFRGADIFAYLQAAGDVAADKRFTLTGNWRSTPRLLSALNTVFTHGPKPFVHEQIAYHEVTSGAGDQRQPLSSEEQDAAPLQFWHLPLQEDGTAVNVGAANDLIPPAVAGEIVRLLRDAAAGRALIGDRPLAPGDIAVIVRSHRQAGTIQSALLEQGVPSVLRSDQSLFATAEAREVLTLLEALADPGHESKVRAALVTAILGRTGHDIDRYLNDEPAWEERLLAFRDLHQLWRDRGFMIMAQTLLNREGVRGRLLRFADGERRLTNVLHCFEVLHRQEHQLALGCEGLLSWFGERVGAGDTAEEYQIRLETDEKAVKIVTVHVSKGLEYPVVFCPYLWGGIRAGDEVVAFHDAFTMVKDFGSPEQTAHRMLAQQESLAESLRLLYVALTRAKIRCYLVGGKIVDKTGKNRPETSPLSYLFHASDPTRTRSADLVGALAQEVSSLSAAAMMAQLQALEGRGAGTIAVAPLPPPPVDLAPLGAVMSPAELACRTFSASISSDWRVASFTAFARHDATAPEAPDRDEARPGGGDLKAPTAAAAEQRSIFAFPKGAQTGIFWHEIFENLDFSAAAPEHIEILVTRGLAKYGFEESWRPCLCAMVDNVVHSPLPTPSGSLTLAELRRGSWLAELEFFFPLSFLTSERLRDTLHRWGSACPAVDLERIGAALHFKPVRGMVRGFIDLVFEHDGRFYLLDWKSNYLGDRGEDYAAPALQAAMESNLYPLQYLLYSVALNRYLALRVQDYRYETHFGGVYYLFVRGMDARRGDDFGVYYHRPPQALIDDLCQLLLQSGG